ncbi:aminotransferase class V-fold PLP-dependent enzyme [Phenylobacterium sp.]|uniref:aminotransferase class V-fold PLP-dependent enzyme n=1 Tax=Phenylobacterium sp. TaxID=1871053 RepID=UPI0035C7D4EB
MDFTRRALVAAAAATPALGAGAARAETASPPPLPTELPARPAFAEMPFVYLDSGATHPMPLAAKAALSDYLAYKTRAKGAPDLDMGELQKAMVENFAALVGGTADEIAVIQSTTMGENLVLQALGIPASGGRIVTDALHFFGSYYTYGRLGEAGMDVVTLPMTPEGKTDMDAMAAAIDGKTKLVAISAVSTVNGFQHDLKAVCDLAHAHGAYVYVDLAHAAGTVPLDLRAAGVDFAATSSYKWLMGDFGLGFLYARKEVLSEIARPWWGYHQVSRFTSHVLPYDPPGETVADYAASETAEGYFAMGTTSWTGVVQLAATLPWIRTLDVARIQTWRQPLADAVQTELRGRGYEPLTPLGSRTPLVAFALKDASGKLGPLLREKDVRITVSRNRFRVSLSVFNDMNDLDRLFAALPKAPPA